MVHIMKLFFEQADKLLYCLGDVGAVGQKQVVVAHGQRRAQLEEIQAVGFRAHQAVAGEGGGNAGFRQVIGSDHLRHLDFDGGRDACLLKDFERACAQIDVLVDADEVQVGKLAQVYCRHIVRQVLALVDVLRAQGLRQQIFRQLVSGGDGQKNGVRKGGIAFKFADSILIAAEGEIKLVVVQKLDEPVGAGFGDGDVDVGEFGVELRYIWRENVGVHIMSAADNDVAGLHAVDIVNLLLQLLLEQQLLLDVVDVQLADVREGERALVAVEDGGAYFLLHLFDGYAERRLGDEEGLRSLGKAAVEVNLVDVVFF